MKPCIRSLLIVVAVAAATPASAAGCDVPKAASTNGMTATGTVDGTRLEWRGDGGQKLRLTLARIGDTPLVRDLSLWRGGWVPVIENATPEFSVTTGLRRMSNQQMQPLRELGVPIDQTVIDKYRWDPFWDAPLNLDAKSGRGRYGGNPPPAGGVPGTDQPGLPRSPAEIETTVAGYVPFRCVVRRDGTHLSVDLAGVRMGAFTGKVRFTVYAGTNLIRQEVLASTARRWLAYKFSAGLRLNANPNSALHWRDISGDWHQDGWSADTAEAEVPIIARNRVVAFATPAGSLAFFPEPHKFFWAREVAINMGTQWRRRSGDSVAFGIRQNDKEDDSEDPANWALYNARPGTIQRMPMFLYPTLSSKQDAIAGALSFTRNDTYKPLAGFKVLNHHYHTDLGERALAAGASGAILPDVVALKATGINIVSMVDTILFTPPPPAPGGDGQPTGPRRQESDAVDLAKASFRSAAAQSDRDFVIWPTQEVYGGPLGGHTDLLFSHKVLWHRKIEGRAAPAQADGKVYEIATADDLMAMVRAENILISMPHPRTKGSTGYPDAISGSDYFLDPHFHGTGMRWGMGLDGSEERLCERRCWPLLDDMSNWMVRSGRPLKKVLSISEVRHISPGDDVYASQPVTYVTLNSVPTDGNFARVIDALQNRESFWTTGEVLAHGLTTRLRGALVQVQADVEWTFPLAFVEVHYGDGLHTWSARIDARDLAANGHKRFVVNVPARKARWIRFSAWDIASDGAVIQPKLP